MRPTLVTSYVNPDLDGVAGMVAYAEFLQKTGTNAVAGILGEPQGEAVYMLDRFGVAEPVRIPNADDFDAVILVDSSDPNELEGRVPPEKVVEIIDHRTVNEATQFPNAEVHIEPIGAAATLVAEKFMHGTVEISKGSASLLYGAIISNSLNFQGSMTTERDRAAAAWLNTIAQLPEDFWREQFLAKSDMAGGKLAKRIEDDFAWFVLGGKKIGIAELELMGARKLLDERSGEIVQVLERIKETMRLDFIFQNTIELEHATSFLVASDVETQALLTRVFGVSFTGVIAELPHPLMRKQIVPLLKKALG